MPKDTYLNAYELSLVLDRPLAEIQKRLRDGTMKYIWTDEGRMIPLSQFFPFLHNWEDKEELAYIKESLRGGEENMSKRVAENPKKIRCCICGGEINGYGNNAAPIRHGRCCDKCNSIVIAARLASMR